MHEKIFIFEPVCGSAICQLSLCCYQKLYNEYAYDASLASEYYFYEYMYEDKLLYQHFILHSV